MPFGLGFGEVLLIFAVLLLLFGAKRLPEIGGAMGRSIRDFKRGINGLNDDPAIGPGDETRRAAPEAAPQRAEEAPAADPAPAEDQPRSLRQE